MHYCGHCDFKCTRRYNIKVHMGRKHAALEDDEDKKGETEVLNGEGMKQDEIKSTNKILETEDDSCCGVCESCFEHDAEYMFDSD